MGTALLVSDGWLEWRLPRILKALDVSCQHIEIQPSTFVVVKNILFSRGSEYSFVVLSCGFQALSENILSFQKIMNQCQDMIIPIFVVAPDLSTQKTKVYSPGKSLRVTDFLEEINFSHVFLGDPNSQCIWFKIIRRIIASNLYDFTQNLKARTKHKKELGDEKDLRAMISTSFANSSKIRNIICRKGDPLDDFRKSNHRGQPRGNRKRKNSKNRKNETKLKIVEM